MKISFTTFALTTASAVLLLACAPTLCLGQGSAPIAPPNSKPYGHSYSDWSALWWQWVYAAPVSQNPLFMNGDVDLSLNQPEGPVWFLGGAMTVVQYPNNLFVGQATRSGIVPAGKALFFPILNMEEDNATLTPPGTNSTDQLRAMAKSIMDTATNMQCTINGVSVQGLSDPLSTPYRVLSPVFNYWLPPEDNVEQNGGVEVSGMVSNAVSDGVFLMLQPLAVGNHTVHFTGTFPVSTNLPYTFTLDITYQITVTLTIAPPDSPSYGHSYSDWSALWWQWMYSLPVNTNQLSASLNPLFLDSNVDLSLNQPDGPVWFLGGMMVLNTVQVTNVLAQATRTGTVPYGKALFFPILNCEWDNPTTSGGPYTTAQLQAMAKTNMDSGTNMVCTVDGVSIANLTNSLTTPYRVASSAFDFQLPTAAPPLENVMQYWGMDLSGTVPGAVADGVFLMLDPLPVGLHTIHFAGSFPGNPSFTLDITYQITVTLPIAPPDSTPYGHSYSDWSALWWQWVYAVPVSQNPLFMDGDVDLSLNQPEGPVWFLGGAMTVVQYPNNLFVGQATRSGTVPAGKALFFPILNMEEDNATLTPPGTNSTDQLRAMAKSIMDTATNMQCTINGVSVQGLSDPLSTPYRVLSPVFNYWLPPEDNVEQNGGVNVSGTVSNAVSDGVFLMLQPLAVGNHTVHFTGTFPVSTNLPYIFTLDITYHLDVTPVLKLSLQPGNTLSVSWNASVSGYVLESAPDLRSGLWVPVPGVLGNQLIVQPTEGRRFYRLHKK